MAVLPHEGNQAREAHDCLVFSITNKGSFWLQLKKLMVVDKVWNSAIEGKGTLEDRFASQIND